MATARLRFPNRALRASPALLACAAVLAVAAGSPGAFAQRGQDDSYHPPADSSTLQPPPGYSAPSPAGGYGQNTYGQPQTYGTYGQAPGYGQPPATYGQAPNPGYGAPQYGAPPSYGGQAYGGQGNGGQTYANQANGGSGGYAPYAPGQGGGEAYSPPRSDTYSRPDGYGAPYSAPPNGDQPPPGPDGPTRGYYSQGEITEAGRGFFGSITKGLASAIEYTYASVGRPNGYILGEDGGGAFFAGLRYGEGKMFTKDAGDYRVFWQGPSLGYDVGGEGSKIMILAYNLRDPGEIYNRFGGVEGSTYLVGGVSVQLQKYGDVTLAVIRSGVGLRLGVNVGYLKYTREPTWNPF